MEEIQIGQVLGHFFRVGQARIFVFRGVLGNGQSRSHGLTDSIFARCGRTGRALAVYLVQGNTEALITIELNRFNLALANGCR